VILALVGVSVVSAVACWVGYAFMTGRRMKQRLTEADPIPELA
jgi:hypothetical protein